MRFYSFIASTLILTLAACGGGSEGPVNPVSPTPTPDPGPTQNVGTIPYAVLSSLADGSSVVKFETTDGLVYKGFVETLTLADTLRTQNYVITTPTSSSAQGYYTQTLRGQSGDGNQITLVSNGVVLGNNEIASVVLVENENIGRANLAVGTKPVSLPQSNVTYAGKAQAFQSIPVTGADPLETQETGSFALTLDFTGGTPQGRLTTADMSKFQFSVSDITLDPATGGLASSSVSIGTISGTQVSGLMQGQIMGEKSTGVAGIVRSQTTGTAYTGVFYGKQ